MLQGLRWATCQWWPSDRMSHGSYLESIVWRLHTLSSLTAQGCFFRTCWVSPEHIVVERALSVSMKNLVSQILECFDVIHFEFLSFTNSDGIERFSLDLVFLSHAFPQARVVSVSSIDVSELVESQAPVRIVSPHISMVCNQLTSRIVLHTYSIQYSFALFCIYLRMIGKLYVIASTTTRWSCECKCRWKMAVYGLAERCVSRRRTIITIVRYNIRTWTIPSATLCMNIGTMVSFWLSHFIGSLCCFSSWVFNEHVEQHSFVILSLHRRLPELTTSTTAFVFLPSFHKSTFNRDSSIERMKVTRFSNDYEYSGTFQQNSVGSLWFLQSYWSKPSDDRLSRREI